MIPLIKEQPNQLIENVSNKIFDTEIEGSKMLVNENKLQSNYHNEVLKAYETIKQKLQESNEEWWLVSSKNEDKGFAYRKHLPSKSS